MLWKKINHIVFKRNVEALEYWNTKAVECYKKRLKRNHRILQDSSVENNTKSESSDQEVSEWNNISNWEGAIPVMFCQIICLPSDLSLRTCLKLDQKVMD